MSIMLLKILKDVNYNILTFFSRINILILLLIYLNL